MLFSRQISDLKATVQDLEGKLAAASGNVVALTAEKEKLDARVKELEAAAGDSVSAALHAEKIGEKNQEISALNAKLEAAEKNVDKKVVEQIANAGVPAVKRDPKAVDNPAKTTPTGDSPRKRLAAIFNDELAGK